MGFHGGSAGKESSCSAGDLGSIPESERSPGEGNGYRLLPGEFHGQRSLVNYSPIICSILFWFHFEDDIVNYLSESLFLKNLSESLFLKKTTNLYLVSSRTSQGTPGVHPACLRRMACWRKKPTRGAWWVSPKRVWPDWFNEDLVQSSVCRERNKKKEKEKANEKDVKYIIQ